MASSAERLLESQLRRLRWRTTGTWAAAWAIGILSLAAVATSISTRLTDERIDATLARVAMATYGLTWFDAAGRFHDDLFWREPDLAEAPLDVWVVDPRREPPLLLAPVEPCFDLPDLRLLARRVAESQEGFVEDGIDRAGRTYRLHARPTYDDASDRIRAVILVAGDPRPQWRLRDRRNSAVWTAATALLIAGCLVGYLLAGRSLRPLARHLRQREAFLVATAHELRTPLAALRAHTETDAPPPPDSSTVPALVSETAAVVDDLLHYAQLDAGTRAITREPCRVDLLVEAELPEPAPFELDAELEPWTARVDPSLLGLAVRNLVRNALQHGASPPSLRIASRSGTIVVEAAGSGFPEHLLRARPDELTAVPSQGGSGLGVAIVAMVARLHGGELALENRAEGGSRATLRIPLDTE